MTTISGGAVERAGQRSKATAVYVLCVLGALIEGYDLQAAGLAAPKYGPAFALQSQQVGYTFTANTLGLFIGAVIGGRLADRIGRRAVLIGSMAVFGVFSIGSALSGSFEVLTLMRLLTGVGLGGAMPNLIALISESGSRDTIAMRVTMMTAAMPAGGALAGALVLSTDMSWQMIFHVGGWLPIGLALMMLVALPESREYQAAKQDRETGGDVVPASSVHAWFGEGRARATLFLWVCMLGTLTALYLLLNWMPTLLVGKGFSRPEATLIALTFSVGGALGAILLGMAMKRLAALWLFVGVYIAMGLALWGLALVERDLALAMLASLVAGVFVVGAQFLLYGLSPTLYPLSVRGTGVGGAIAVGRIGAVLGPLAAGQILAAGYGASAVIYALIPIIALALLAAIGLLAGRGAEPVKPAAAVG